MLIPLILCTRTCVYCGCYHFSASALLLYSACHLVLGVGLPHIPRVCMGVTLLVFFWWAAALRLNNLWFTPPCPKIHHRDYIDGIPLNAKMSGAWQK